MSGSSPTILSASVLAFVVCASTAAIACSVPLANSVPAAPGWSDPAKPSAARGGWEAGAERVQTSWARAASGGFVVRFDVALKSGWHTYWQNPGDSGDSPAISWKLPEGWKAGPILYPRPDAKPMDGFPFYGYEGKATFLVQIDRAAPAAPASSSTPATPATPAASPAPSTAPAPNDSWQATCTLLICKERCVQGAFDFGGTWPPTVTAGAVPLDTEQFDGRKLPQSTLTAGVKSQLEGNTLKVSGLAQGQSTVSFIPLRSPGLTLAGSAAETGIVRGSVKDGRFELVVQFERTPADSTGRLPDAEGLVLLGDAPTGPSVYVRASSGETKPKG